MTLREILSRRDAIRVELRTHIDKHPDGALPTDVEARVTDLETEAERLNAAERRQVMLDDLDRRAAGAQPVEDRAADDGDAVFGLAPEQRMASFVTASTGTPSAGLSVGRAIRGMLTGRWDGADAERRVMGTSPGASGGFLMPDPISANLIDLARNASVVVQAGARTIPMDSKNLRVVQVLSDPTAAWRAEGSAISESDGTFSTLNLTAHSLAAMVRVNNELLEDVPTFAATLDQQLASALALELDRVALYGTGAGMPLGLRGCSGVAEKVMGANGAALTDYDDILDLLQAVEEANGSATTAVMAPRTRTKLAKLKTGIASDLTKLTAPAEYIALRRLVSNQVSVTEAQGSSNVASTMFLGGFENMAFAIRQDVTIEASRVADDSFAKNQTLVRAIMRADVAIYRPAHFGRLVGVL